MAIKFVINAEDTTQMLLELKTKNADYTPAFEKVAIHMEASVAKNFRAQGRPGWKPLKASTLKARRKGGKGGKILQDMGTLRASVTSNVGIKKISALRFEYGTNLVYAAAQNFGYRHIPARPFLMFQPEDTEAILRIFKEHVEGS